MGNINHLLTLQEQLKLPGKSRGLLTHQETPSLMVFSELVRLAGKELQRYYC